MRIGIEAQRIFRRKRHGMDIVALETIRHLQALDTENEYFIFVKPDLDREVIQPSKNMHIIELKGFTYADWEQIALPMACKKYKIDVLHCTSNTAPIFCPVPLVITLHDVIYLEKENLNKGSLYQTLGSLYRRWIVPIVAKKAKHIITVSNYERDTILSTLHLPSDRVSTIYNGASDYFTINPSQEQLDALRAHYRLPKSYFLCLGNTAPKKNVSNTLKGYALARKQHKNLPPLVLLDFSHSALKVALENIAEPELNEHIQLIGYVPNMQLPALYQMACLFLYTSLRESFGIPMIEAMRCGTPVIASNTSAMPEISAKAALYIHPNDPQDIADKIIQLFNNTKLQNEMRTLGLENAQRFSWSKTAALSLEQYKAAAY